MIDEAEKMNNSYAVRFFGINKRQIYKWKEKKGTNAQFTALEILLNILVHGFIVKQNCMRLQALYLAKNILGVFK